MNTLLITLIALALAIAFALLVMQDPGYVLITLKPWSIELSLTLFLVILAVVFVVLYLSLRALVRMWNAPGNLQQWRARNLKTKAHKLQTRGIMGLIEGNWDKAERQLLSHLTHSDTPALNFLGAAQAAQGRGDLAMRDRYLAQAYEADPSQAAAIGLTQATLQYRSGQHEQALATLKRLRQRVPKNPKVLGLAVKVMAELQDWQGLLEILPDARKHNGVPAAQADELQAAAGRQLLTHTPQSDQLESVWQAMPRGTRNEPELVAAFAKRQIELGNMSQAEEVLRKAIRREWRPELVRLYGLVKLTEPARQLKVAEKWAQDHPDSPELMLTLAQLSINNELWGKARAYLEACIGGGGSVEAYRELGHLLEQLDERDAALDYYRDGLDQALPRDNQPILLSTDQEQAAATDTDADQSPAQERGAS